MSQVPVDFLPRFRSLNEHGLEIFVKNISDNADRKIRLAIKKCGRSRARTRSTLSFLLDVFPLSFETSDVASQLIFRRTFSGSAHNNASLLGNEILQNVLQARTLSIWQATTNATHPTTRHKYQVATRKAHLTREASSLLADWIFSHLNKYLLASFESGFNATWRAICNSCGIPVHFTCIKNCVTSLADIDERRFHRRQHVLYAPKINIAYVGSVT